MFKSHKSLGASVAGALFALSSASAQIPGAPVLQNAFANPGLSVAANFGGGGGQSLLALAAGWGLGSGRIALSGAAGAQRSNESTRGAYGARASITAWTSAGGSLGAAAFAGVGGAPRTENENDMTNPAVLAIPAGITAGYRRNIGTNKGISAYVSPMYRWVRVTTENDSSANEGNFRVSVGIDFSFNPSLGVTAGGDFGSGETGESTFGAAVSWVPGGRR